MDEGDYGNRCADQFFKTALRNHRARTARPAGNAKYCDGCGDVIPAERRKAVPGCRLCIICQTLAEKER